MKKGKNCIYMHKLRVQQTLLCILGSLRMQSGCYKCVIPTDGHCIGYMLQLG